MWDWDDEDEGEDDGEDDSVDWDRARTATRDRDGNVRWRGVWRAVRGRGSDHDDMLPSFAVTLFVFLLAIVAVALDGGASTVDTLTWAALLVVLFVGIVAKGVGRRLDEYHADDPDVESRLLAERYAAGDLDDEEFERRIEVLLEDGAAAAREIDAEDADESDDETAEDDPLATLRRRFAAGEIDDEEYRSRLETLRETTADDPSLADRQRELDRE